MTKSKLSKDGFVKLPKNPVIIPTFLSGDFGRDFLEEFLGRARADYGNPEGLAKTSKNGLDILIASKRDDVIKGSNPYVIILANQILRQEGLRTPTSVEIEGVLESGDLPLSKVYVDTALILRGEKETRYEGLISKVSEYLAKGLRKQLGEKKLPVMIPLAGLDLKVDKSVRFGLAFDLREDADVIPHSEKLYSKGRFNSEGFDEKTGLRKKVDGRNSGLMRFYLGRSSYIGSLGKGIGFSGNDGRIVVVKDKKKSRLD